MARINGENACFVHDIIYETNTKRISGIILIIDIEKGFDSIPRSFMVKA